MIPSMNTKKTWIIRGLSAVASGTFAAGVVATGLMFLNSNSLGFQDGSKDKSDNWWSDFTFSEPDVSSVETNRLNRAAYANVVRNPLDFKAQTFKTTSVIHESRTPIFLDDPKYDAVGRLLLMDETNTYTVASCTATISTIDGYQADQDIITSSGHCFDKDDIPQNSISSGNYYPIGRFLFVTDYIDTDGRLQRFTSALTTASVVFSETRDLAVAALEQDVPDGMIKGRVIPDFRYQINDLVSAPGFSGDKVGLHTDNCKVKAIHRSEVRNTCDIQVGASGGPLETSPDVQKIIYGAVLSSYNYGQGSDYLTTHSLITSEFLDHVGFLEGEDGKPSVLTQESPRMVSSSSRQCVKITANDEINIRDGRSTDFNVIARAVQGAEFVELDRVGNWSKIQLPDTNRSAYIHNGYAHRFPC